MQVEIIMPNKSRINEAPPGAVADTLKRLGRNIRVARLRRMLRMEDIAAGRRERKGLRGYQTRFPIRRFVFRTNHTIKFEGNYFRRNYMFRDFPAHACERARRKPCRLRTRTFFTEN